MVLLTDVIAIGMMIGLVLTALIPLKPQRIIYGILIFIFGLLPLLDMFGVFSTSVYTNNLFKFATIYIVMIIGQILFTEAIKEENIILKILSMVFGLVIVLVTMIPWMGDYHAISFAIPSYTPIVDFAIYVVSGVLTIIGAFKAQV